MKENQLSRWGAISKQLPIMNPGAKVFFVSDTTNTAYLSELIAEFPTDRDGVNRVSSTIASAIDNTVANRGDVILVLPGHSETVTAAIALDVAGISVIGIGNGSLKPTIIGDGTIDAVNITANDVLFENFEFGAPLTDSQTSMINIVGTGVTVRGITGVGSTGSENVVDCITVTATADDLLIEDVKLHNSVVAVNSFLSLEGAASRVTIKNFFAFGDVATAGIIDGSKIDYLFLDNVVVGVIGTTKPAAVLDSNPEGLARNCYFAGTHGTIANNAALGNLMRLSEVFVSEETDGSAQGARIPAFDGD